MGFILQYGYVLCHVKVSDLYVQNLGIALLHCNDFYNHLQCPVVNMVVALHHKVVQRMINQSLLTLEHEPSEQQLLCSC